MARKYITYASLLAEMSVEADRFSVVWRNVPFEQSAFCLDEQLAPWLISDYRVSSWPRTSLVNEKARLKTYALNADTLKIIQMVGDVFHFIAPKYPEDIAFYDGKTVLFSSVAHEGMAWFD